MKMSAWGPSVYLQQRCNQPCPPSCLAKDDKSATSSVEVVRWSAFGKKGERKSDRDLGDLCRCSLSSKASNVCPSLPPYFRFFWRIKCGVPVVLGAVYHQQVTWCHPGHEQNPRPKIYHCTDAKIIKKPSENTNGLVNQ